MKITTSWRLWFTTRRFFFMILVGGLILYWRLVGIFQDVWVSSSFMDRLEEDAVAAIATLPLEVTPSSKSGKITFKHKNATTTRSFPENEDEKEVQICFVVSLYGQWAAHMDQLQRVDKLPFYENDAVKFLAFTNLPNLKCQGWTRLVRPLPQYRRYITQSRYYKFFAWNDTYIQKEARCQVIFYMDAIGHIRPTSWNHFQPLARTILASTSGHAQYLHPGGGGALGEFRRIQVFHKDIPSNIQASKEWFRNQSDFQLPANHNCTLYENRYIGYAVRPNTTLAQAASHCFWPRYSLELDSWRDQPLWCHCLDRTLRQMSGGNRNSNSNSNNPAAILPLDHKTLWQLRPHRMSKHNNHQYQQEYGTDTDTKKKKKPGAKVSA